MTLILTYSRPLVLPALLSLVLLLLRLQQPIFITGNTKRATSHFGWIWRLGPFEQILLQMALRGGGGVSGAGVSGAGVSGAGVSGAGVSGAGVSGAGVSGAGVSGAGVSGAGVRR